MASTPSAITDSPAKTKAQVLDHVLSLAVQFSTCVEAFSQIHPSKDSDHGQKLALTRLGLQQGRLLIFGDAVGISSPPPNIAKHMIPSHPALTNPDPTLPVNFGVRDVRLDDPTVTAKVKHALGQIEGRTSHLSRTDLMGQFGLKSPKRFTSIDYPTLDTNRLEAFREKYNLLQDLVRQSGAKVPARRGMSMSMSHWTIRDVHKFADFVTTVREEVDGLIALMDVQAQVDRGMKSDIHSMGWHPELASSIVKKDLEKLDLIHEACLHEYPEYSKAASMAAAYVVDELQGTSLAYLGERKTSVDAGKLKPPGGEHGHAQGSESGMAGTRAKSLEKRPSWLSHFKRKSSTGAEKSKASAASATTVPQRSKSVGRRKDSAAGEADDSERVRSMSLPAVPAILLTKSKDMP